MKSKEELNAMKEEAETVNRMLEDEELEHIVGGNSQDAKLLKYLRKIAPDKADLLVDRGEGKELRLNNTVDLEQPGNVYVVKREKSDAEKAGAVMDIAGS